MRVAILFVLALGGVSPWAGAQSLFSKPMLLPGAEGGAFVAAADLESDGDLDLVRFSSAQGTGWQSASAWLGGASGAFHVTVSVALSSSEIVSAGAAGAIFADVDGDGFRDLVTTGSGGVGSSVLRLVTCRGSSTGLGPAQYSPLNLGYVTNLVALDSDHDGRSEVAVSNTGRVLFFEFIAGSMVRTATIAPTPAPGALLAADIDQDGTSEIVALATTHDRILRFDFDGTSWQTLNPIALPSLAIDPNQELMAGDLDGLGVVDLVVLTKPYANPEVQVALSRFTGLGGGAFAAPTALPVTNPTATTTFFGLHGAALTDWDRDGDLDVLNAGIEALENIGGAFAEAGYEPMGVSAERLLIADVDADAFPDAIVGDAILFGRGAFDFPTASVAVPPGAGLADDLRDVDDDGDLDLVVRTTAKLFRNDGTGSFTSAPPLVVVNAPFTSPPAPGTYDGPPLVFADLTGDGLPDFLQARSVKADGLPIQPLGTFVTADDGGGHYSQSTLAFDPSLSIGLPVAPNPSPWWPVADLDGDGDWDIAVDSGFHPSNGANQVGPRVPAYFGQALAVLDIDADGIQDVLTTSPSSGRSELWLQRGQAIQSGISYLPSLLLTDLEGRLTFAAADLDADGRSDLVISSAAGNRLDVLRQIAPGVLQGVTSFAHGNVGTEAKDVAVRDLDGDQDLDILALRRSTSDASGATSAQAWMQDGTSLDFLLLGEWKLGSVRQLGDLDQDGDLDAIGDTIRFGSTFAGASAGAIAQYGVGSAGKGDATPILGASGPLRSDSTTASLRLRRGLGASLVWLIVGASSVDLPGVPFPATHFYVGNVVHFLPIPLAGQPGAVGTGRFDIPIPMSSGFAGVELFLQGFVADPNVPPKASATNGLALTIGS